ncbi:MAG: membrane protein insertase YidC [Bacteroidota bacterium]|nr:membrane protein insertase YidC [Bacteroidota bacterium]MDP4215250.1 membrane protein insertase YidC [Bacteroidota bacterium]MDP4247270.1 membrane protein insertase YidC [Bacteroidota bacterium]MDP4253504.1 membrane protein insertase YidC [Bacteroidota bacterium]MDP4258098.1 membrane protein insertase YidC [Bacteroidota bacterium]
MGFDRNTVIGFVLLGLLLFIYLFTSTRNSQTLERQRRLAEDSIANVKARQQAAAKLQDTAHVKPVPMDTAVGFNRALTGPEQLLTVENDLMKVVFSNHGGQPVQVRLKEFSAYDSTPVNLVEPATGNFITYPINTGAKQTAEVSELFFEAGKVVNNADGSQTVSFRLPAPSGVSLVHEFTIHPHAYLIDWNVNMNNPGALLTENNFNLVWHDHVRKTQKNIMDERRYASICFYEDNAFDYMQRGTDKTFDKPVQWVSVCQQFFNTALIAKQNFNSGSVAAHWIRSDDDSTNTVGTVDVSLQAKVTPGSSATLSFQLYYGPNDYSILKKQAPGMDKIIDLGRGMYSFVRPLNVYVIMPVFNFFKKFIKSYGLAIMLLTIFIRLITSPLVYTSYLSGAKMKALRPEIEAMKKRVGNDQQQVGMEQMKLFREAGVNPLGGCIPALLQIPIFFALYSFFSSNIALRGEHFLWSKDLSTFDSVLNLGFSIPGYGDHVSLFALLAVATSFLITLYGMSMTPDQSNPVMKYMPYIMPVMLLLFFNRLSSALTWYYTVSNAITLIIQFVIQNYIIDHDQILAKLQQNRSKPKTKSKWQERLEQMQEAQKKAQQSRK